MPDMVVFIYAINEWRNAMDLILAPIIQPIIFAVTIPIAYYSFEAVRNRFDMSKIKSPLTFSLLTATTITIVQFFLGEVVRYPLDYDLSFFQVGIQILCYFLVVFIVCYLFSILSLRLVSLRKKNK